MHKVKWQKLLKLTQLLSLLFNKKLKNLKASWKLIFFFFFNPYSVLSLGPGQKAQLEP